MNDLPFFLSEAIVTLYPASADGSTIAGGAVWSGALVNRLRMALAYEEVRVMGSGEAYSTARHVDEETILTLGRTWILPKGTSIQDFKPARNQQYILQALWNSDGYWYNRTWYGVTGRMVTMTSKGTREFLTDQVFRAQYYRDSGGPNTAPVYAPGPPTGETEPIGFFREDPFVAGGYLLGTYVWQEAVTVGLVEFIGLAPQSPVTLGLEVGGVLTGQTLVIPAGGANTTATVTENLGGYSVPAGNTVRWKIVSGPAPESSAYQAALMMQVTT